MGCLNSRLKESNFELTKSSTGQEYNTSPTHTDAAGVTSLQYKHKTERKRHPKITTKWLPPTKINLKSWGLCLEQMKSGGCRWQTITGIPTSRLHTSIRRAQVTMEREARGRRGFKSNASKKGSDTKVTLLLDPTRAKVFTQRHPTMKGQRQGSTKTPPRRRMTPKSVTVIGFGQTGHGFRPSHRQLPSNNHSTSGDDIDIQEHSPWYNHDTWGALRD
jgi:hypothetical protein